MGNRFLSGKFVLSFAWFVCWASAVACAAPQSSDPFRTWTDASGKFQKTAKLVTVEDGLVTLEKKDGIQLQIQLAQLSKQDQLFVETWIKSSQNNNEKVDEAAPAERNLDIPPVQMDQAILPDHACETCRGSGLVPVERLRPLVHVRATDDETDLNENHIGKCCPLCQPGGDPAELSLLYDRPHDESVALHQEWQEELDTELLQIDTHYLTIRSQLPERQATKIAQGLERMEGEMQKLFGTMIFSHRRRGVDEHFVFNNRYTYDKFIDRLAETEIAEHDWDMIRQVALSYWRDKTFVNLEGHTGSPVGSSVFVSAYAQFDKAANWAKVNWLRSGFAAHFEALITKENSCYMSGRVYDDGEEKIRLRNVTVDNANWDRVVKLHARQNKLIPWSEMYFLDYGNYEQLHDLQAKSMATFLLREPQRFSKLVDLLAAGTEQLEALEQAYEKAPDELEAEWKKWVR